MHYCEVVLSVWELPLGPRGVVLFFNIFRYLDFEALSLGLCCGSFSLFANDRWMREAG